MTDQYETFHEHKISSLIETQFPEYFREEGQTFVAFVKEYFKWLESASDIAENGFTGTGYITVNAKQANVSGRGTDFTTWFANGDPIAIFRQDSKTDYDLFTINTVSNSTFLTLSTDTLPSFSSVNSWYSTIRSQNNPNYYLRRYMEFKDIDTTVDSFLVYFKEKYLKNIQFNTKSNMKTFLKHSLDLYRSKGTERSVDLLFRAVFGVPASVYYPGDDIFRLSDGKWYRPLYLEISIKKDSEKLIGKQIVGASSGATGFAESLVRRIVKGRIVDILYISAVRGNFQTGEAINSADNVLGVGERPTIVGSLTAIDVDIDGTGSGFEVGDFVDIYSDYGEQGRGIVTSTIGATGKVNFDLINGGYGYTVNAEVLVSDKILGLSNVRIAATNSLKSYVALFDQMTQPLANIEFSSISSGMFANNDLIYTWDGGLQKGVGRVISMANTSATAGWLFVSILSGNLNYATIYSASNTRSATVDVYTNATCIANTIGTYANVSLTLASVVGSFSVGEEIVQTDQYGLVTANGAVLSFQKSGTVGSIIIEGVNGVYQNSKTIRGRTSNATANVQSTDIYVGVMGISNVFYSITNNYVYFANSSTNATIRSISSGALANVGFSNNLIYTETVSISNDYISTNATHYLPIALNAATYDFPKYPSGNLTSGTLSQMFNSEAYTLGKIYQLEGINQGDDYTAAPIVRIYEPISAALYRQDLILEVSNILTGFQVGEIVTQESTSARGLIKYGNSSHIGIELLRMSKANDFIVTTNTATLLVGEQTQATANITKVDVDTRSEYLGFNAVLDVDVRTVEGSINGIEIDSSGFGYKEGDSLRLVKSGLPYTDNNAGFGLGRLITQGRSQGYYKRKGGWLSDQSKLFDGIYYQEYSYEVRSSITLNKYEEMLRQLLHIAGTKYFGALVYKTEAAANTTFRNAVITSGTEPVEYQDLGAQQLLTIL